MNELKELKVRAAERRNDPNMYYSDGTNAEAEDDLDHAIVIAEKWENRITNFMLSEAMLEICLRYTDKVPDDAPDIPLRCVELLLKDRDELLEYGKMLPPSAHEGEWYVHDEQGNTEIRVKTSGNSYHSLRWFYGPKTIAEFIVAARNATVMR